MDSRFRGSDNVSINDYLLTVNHQHFWGVVMPAYRRRHDKEAEQKQFTMNSE